jgi:hypothetical protein
MLVFEESINSVLFSDGLSEDRMGFAKYDNDDRGGGDVWDGEVFDVGGFEADWDRGIAGSDVRGMFCTSGGVFAGVAAVGWV